MYKLSIHDLRLWVHLGCGHEERHHPQKMSITVDVYFNNCPKGAKTDNLNDTACYLQTVNTIIMLAQNQHFHLIEHLAQSIHQAIINHLSLADAVSVTVLKMAPPVQHVHGGISFTYAPSNSH
jgi:dihydroneopterin aldolase